MVTLGARDGREPLMAQIPPNWSNYYRPPGQWGPGGPLPPGPAEVTIDAIGIAWNITKSDFGLWVPTVFLVIVINYAVSLPFNFATNLLVYGSIFPFNPSFEQQMVALGVSLIGSVIIQAVTYALHAGMMNMGLKKLEGAPTGVADLFSAFPKFLQLFAAGFLVGLVTGVGFVLLIVPGLYLMGALSLTPLLVVRQNLGPIDAMQRSMEIMKGGRAFAMFGVMFVAGLCSALGACACGIGMLFTLPIFYCTVAVTYYNFFASASAYPYTMPPIQWPTPGPPPGTPEQPSGP